MAEYEFQWGGAHTLFSIYDRSCWSYGPYVFGEPAKVDYVAIGENTNVDAYLSKEMVDEWEEMAERLLDRGFAEEMLKRSEGERKKTDGFFEIFRETDLPSIENTQVWAKIDELCCLIREVGKYFSATQDASTKPLEKKLRQALEGKDFALLTMPVGVDIIGKERADLMRLAMKESVSDGDILGHAERHAWIFYQAIDKAKNIAFLRKRVEEEKRKGSIRKRMDEAANEKRELKEKQEAVFAGMDEEAVWLCRLFQLLATERLELKSCWAGAEWRFLPLFKEASKRTSIALTDLLYAYTLADMREALVEGKQLDSTVAQERKKLYAVRRTSGKPKLYSSSETEELRKELGLGKTENVSEIRGAVANPGKAKGRAYVVKVMGVDQLAEDEAKFRDGDVLITTMTQPSHAALVQRSAAVVADEGGMSSHASVIAREFNKPCIVGAKIATRIIKTGDLVEVDADNGVVRKLQNQ
ncbi:hypothetical protein HZC09_00620 [Candidatus Micrarchaeota archaeon]|nr:hypothetical protein [Candidatus Micrarchaeota archaeon]